MPADPDKPHVSDGCRIIIDLVPLHDEEDAAAIPDRDGPSGYRAEVLVVPLPPEESRDPEEWNFDLGHVKSFEPEWALAAAAGTIAPWAERSATVDRARARRD